MIVASQRTWEAWTFPLAFVGGLCAFGAGRALVMVGSDCSERCREAGPVADVSGGYGYLAWAAFVGLTFAVGLWAAWTLGAPAIQVRRSLRDCVNDAVTATVVVLVLAIGILPTATMSADAYPDCICGWHLRVAAVFAIGMVLAIPGIVLLDRLRQVTSCRACKSRLTLAQFLSLRRQLDHCVLVLGGYFTVALLTAGALRLAVIDAGEAFAPIRLILAGAQFTALLMILYWPTRSSPQRSGS